MNRKAESDIRRKKNIFDYAEECGNVSFSCGKYGVSRDSFTAGRNNMIMMAANVNVVAR